MIQVLYFIYDMAHLFTKVNKSTRGTDLLRG